VNLRLSALGGSAVLTATGALTSRIPPILLLGTWSITLIVLAVAQVRLQRRALDGALSLVEHLGRDTTRVIIRRHGEVEIQTARGAIRTYQRRQATPRHRHRHRRRPAAGRQRKRPRP
jgi:hypothetical protein